MERSVVDFDAQTELSCREREVLTHVAQGRTYAATARRMGLSPHTVDTYLRRIRAKAGVVNRVELALLAARIAAVNPPGEPGNGNT
ncbi:helix-turn-helix transcriptional regulator [Streptomyces sp. SL13]|uniref:Helix-turn-helix transcriptional regulator n=1 Tax=Streptantibioticus silvisoli TaxID=2705255 RepID=A0AA90KBI3_9ACTN|nr:helix-turn-helix transcriptional regulator [Streptantibioticus silvisoli]MDI5961419.1 helix-turn-helix transcriptional regulator [Streptantibioticus silvisoli]MDI5973362.1 helix-turn-helix transcriptional regulator [Streptantibioticus silvisoli]